jgi:hypothetical protein
MGFHALIRTAHAWESGGILPYDRIRFARNS